MRGPGAEPDGRGQRAPGAMRRDRCRPRLGADEPARGFPRIAAERGEGDACGEQQPDEGEPRYSSVPAHGAASDTLMSPDAVRTTSGAVPRRTIPVSL